MSNEDSNIENELIVIKEEFDDIFCLGKNKSFKRTKNLGITDFYFINDDLY